MGQTSQKVLWESPTLQTETGEEPSAETFNKLTLVKVLKDKTDSHSDGSDLMGSKTAEGAEPSKEAEDCSC